MNRRRMPSREEIERRAVELYMAENWEISTITPERHELQEEGFIRKAQHELMGTERESQFSSPYASSKGQMREYLEEMAQQLNVRIVSGPEYRKFQRWMLTPVKRIVKKKEPPKSRTRVRLPRPVPVPKVIKDQTSIGIKLPGMPTRVKGKKKVAKIRVQIPGVGKPRKKVGKPTRSRTMRALRKINGVKIFSFPDHVWKVRELGSRKKRRRK